MRSKHISDRSRFSIIQPALDRCYICSRTPVEIHECIPGTANRQKSKDYGLTVALCPEHHREAHKNGNIMQMLKSHAQWEFEKTHTRDEWMEIFHRNYL